MELIAVDGTTTTHEFPQERVLESLQELVGGNIELLRFDDGRLMIIDEEGLIKEKEANWIATQIIKNDASMFSRTPVIVGPVLMLSADEARLLK